MATVEERLQALEQEHTQLKKTIELQTIAIGALVNKATLEKLNDKYDKLFEALMAHDHITNEQLAELRNQHTELDGKIVGLQTEMRQRFSEQDSKLTAIDRRFDEQDSKLTGIETEMRLRFDEQDNKFAAIDRRFNNIETVLTQILARLPEKQS